MERFTYISEMPGDLAEEIRSEYREALSLLGAAGTDTPAEIVEKIYRRAGDYLEQGSGDPDEAQELGITLGCAWAESVIRAYGWRWMHLGETSDEAGVYIVSPNDYYCCPPLYFLTNILSGGNTGLDGRNDNTVLLLFNMLENIEAQRPEEKYTVVA
ncbi:hypothetical protein [Breznakiella homolactica]|uniref:DUF3806 domain-containing protein n=1 Tax=Breznakiella homolactica TaxID=2798577 RepID=A0A7T8B8N2_9SPIR|nr:hypothetical protein [Breznakiella homolactica]QQO08779.1 hypothetical protein JFL75_17900 [Breznakiella homolactica]